MITSAKNQLIKEIRRLGKSKRAREQAGLFIVEGIQGVVELVRGQAEGAMPLRLLVYAPELLTSELAYEAIEQAEGRGVRCEAIAGKLFEMLSGRQNPVGIMALVERQLMRLDELPIVPDGLYVALTEVSDPGNLGTILRTMDAVGARGLILVGQTVDPFHPTAVKASAGTIFSVPLVPVADLETLLRWCQRAGLHIVGTSDQAQKVYWALTYQTPLLLLMGSEAHGLPTRLLDELPQVASIPMQGCADSLNLGVATALMLYEVRRQHEK